MKRIATYILSFWMLLLLLLATGCGGGAPEVRDTETDGRGLLWAATKDGLYRQGSDSLLHPMPLPSLTHHPYPSIYALAIDTVRERLWVGAWNHLYCYDLRRERFVTTHDSLISQTVGLMLDPQGRVLALTEHGQFRFTLSDTIAGGELTEQLDSTAYPKPAATSMDASVWKFETSQSGHLWYAVLILILLIALSLVGIFLYRRRQVSIHTVSSITASDDAAQSMNTTEPPLPARTPFLARAAQVVDAHIADEDFNADVFAQEMAVSRAQLFRKLKAAGGQTVKEFIDERRMAKAAQLLQTTDRTLADIATAVGISDASNFRRVFIKRFGVSPSQFRKGEKEEE